MSKCAEYSDYAVNQYDLDSSKYENDCFYCLVSETGHLSVKVDQKPSQAHLEKQRMNRKYPERYRHSRPLMFPADVRKR